ncbi:MAG: hypothetical protein BA862_08185 [Desulfobulbaceae bacterium S3730MH12]|nr:MAG: hypothetical protein BA866_02230 [Desulfobulbaceae bacterium S5133MH15]OEU56026.1 MAG: hypothetical protein BA862_08185 [Desulfobulbaceae bacterium S3730MH12]OEU82628.1 MAG: hypothetical protein BA873_05850 [Desulfobulbaceae bacterium C00003063]
MKIVDPTNPIPKYLQIKQWLTQQIDLGIFKAGDRLPSEIELAQRCTVSRATLRQAVSSLVDSGILIKKKGMGTYVGSGQAIVELKHDVQKIVSFRDCISGQEIKEKTIVLDKSIIDVDAEISKTLVLGAQKKVVRIQRLRLGNETAYVHEESYLPYRLFKDIVNYDLSTSLYKIITVDFGIELKRAIQEIKAVILNEKMTDFFDIPAKSPGFYMKNITFDQFNTPVELMISYCRGDLYTLELELNEYQLS